jgi:NAD+ synthase
MVLAFEFAEVHNLMVVGAANRTEWFTGTFSKFGVDHCADIMPIVHLYRSEVEEMARSIDIPDYILSKAADPDVLPGLNDKQVLLGDFKKVDQILMMLESGEEDRLETLDFDQSLVHKIVELKELSKPMRESPYSLVRI